METTYEKDVLRQVKRHSVGYIVVASILLGLASLSLLASSLWRTGTALMVGQILFVLLVFAAVTLLVVTAIAQDIRIRTKMRRENGNRA